MRRMIYGSLQSLGLSSVGLGIYVWWIWEARRRIIKKNRQKKQVSLPFFSSSFFFAIEKRTDRTGAFCLLKKKKRKKEMTTVLRRIVLLYSFALIRYLRIRLRINCWQLSDNKSSIIARRVLSLWQINVLIDC